MTIFIVGLVCSFSAGWMQQAFGWQMLNMFLLPWLGAAALAIIVFAIMSRRNDRAETPDEAPEPACS
jgi:hypothetical protein